MRVLKTLAATLSLCTAVALTGPSVAWTADCSQPVTETGGPTIKDCIYIARSSISDLPCATCVCDANGSGDVRITDALRCLWFVVGGEVTLDCPPCNETSTTTLPECASCNDVLIGAAPVEELCEFSQVLYDTMKSCPCNACPQECGSPSLLCPHTEPASAALSTTNAQACVRCAIDECQPTFAACFAD